MNVAHSVERGGRLFPDKPALLWESDSFTYRELDAMSNRVANGLAGLGMARGDRIALYLPNIPAFVIALLGIYKLGAIAVSMNAALKPDEARFILDDSGARVLVTTASLYDQAYDHVAVGPGVQHVLITAGEARGAMALSAFMANAAPHAQTADMAAHDPAVILYTSGTTGFPKGATHSHGSLMANVQASVSTFRMQPEDRVLLCLPVYHNFGQNTVLTPTFAAGATLILQPDFDLTTVLDAVVQHGITMVFGVPTIFALLYVHATPEQMRSVRLYLSAAAPLPLALSQQWQSKFALPIS